MNSLCSNFLYRLQANSVPQPTQGDDTTVREYFRMFTVYLIAIGMPSFSEIARRRFLYGLSAENKVEVQLAFNTLPQIDDVVGYLTEVEVFKRTIFNNSRRA